MAKLTNNELLLISKSTQDKLRYFAEGVQLSNRSGQTIKQLQVQVARDRVKLARLQLKDAKAAIKSKPKMIRTAVSRAYYAMYHAARAASYLSLGGDDHEQHSVLPSKFPADFPNAEVWKNRLKDARLERNRADYDPYPLVDATFLTVAPRLIGEAKELIDLTDEYLLLKSN